jgi:hypothetical protein
MAGLARKVCAATPWFTADRGEILPSFEDICWPMDKFAGTNAARTRNLLFYRITVATKNLSG